MRIRVLSSNVCTPHSNPYWLVDKEKYKSNFEIVVLETMKPLCYGTIPRELPGAAAATRKGTQAVLESLVNVVSLPHRFGTIWCCDFTKIAAAMPSFLQIPLDFLWVWNDFYSCSHFSPFSFAWMRPSLFNHSSYGDTVWCPSSLVQYSVSIQENWFQWD